MQQLEISKWGNSAALRLPRGLLDAMGVAIGDQVSVKVENGQLIISPPGQGNALEQLTLKVEQLQKQVDQLQASATKR